MSGGRAFVLDLDPRLVNPDMVDVLVLPVDQDAKIKSLIERFYGDTGSVVAHSLMSDWDNQKSRISMVMPRDYARVLAAMERAERDGLDVDKVVMEAL
jgi:glutamate synthase (NADPH/NADH) large chain